MKQENKIWLSTEMEFKLNYSLMVLAVFLISGTIAEDTNNAFLKWRKRYFGFTARFTTASTPEGRIHCVGSLIALEWMVTNANCFLDEIAPRQESLESRYFTLDQYMDESKITPSRFGDIFWSLEDGTRFHAMETLERIYYGYQLDHFKRRMLLDAELWPSTKMMKKFIERHIAHVAEAREIFPPNNMKHELKNLPEPMLYFHQQNLALIKMKPNWLSTAHRKDKPMEQQIPISDPSAINFNMLSMPDLTAKWFPYQTSREEEGLGLNHFYQSCYAELIVNGEQQLVNVLIAEDTSCMSQDHKAYHAKPNKRDESYFTQPFTKRRNPFCVGVKHPDRIPKWRDNTVHVKGSPVVCTLEAFGPPILVGIVSHKSKEIDYWMVTSLMRDNLENWIDGLVRYAGDTGQHEEEAERQPSLSSHLHYVDPRDRYVVSQDGNYMDIEETLHSTLSPLEVVRREAVLGGHHPWQQQ